MTLPYERSRAVVQTEKFLLDLVDPRKTPRVPKGIRQRAKWCLKHYPTEFEMELTANNYPDMWNSEFL